MNNRRMQRKKKRKKQEHEQIPCIIFLSSDERDSFDKAEMKENRQLKYINEYADAHGLIPILIVRRGCMSQSVCNGIFMRCIQKMHSGRAEALLVANMSLISAGEADSYHKVGVIREHGFRIFSVDEGELSLDLTTNR